MKFFKRNAKTFKVIAIVLCVLLVGGFLLNMSGSFDKTKTKISEEHRNDANLFIVDASYKGISGTYSGVKITVNSDGSIVLDGKATAAISKVLTATPKTNYTYTISKLNCGDDAPGTKISVNDGITAVATSSRSSDITFQMPAANGTVTVTLEIASGDEFDNLKIYPMIANGVNAQPYYTIVK